ncbi:MAG: 2Fe-2S iron-sulfur cluster-binding protein [Bdellovibrionota bacterium]|nr:2Fe-2S iron-sulfur cluster-binding protein [Bdellovibrionota bacterium]
MKIKFVPQNIEVEVDSNKSVLEMAKEAGVQIKSVCGGTPSCAECKVQIAQGEYNVLPPSDREISLIGTAHFVDHSRLSCQLKCFGDVTIDLNEQIEKQASGAYAKKPSGKAQKAEGEESHAVEGSILLGGSDLDMFGASTQVGIDRTNERRAVEVFDEDETKRALEQIRRKREREKQNRKEDDSDDEYIKKLRSRNKKFQTYGEADEEEDMSSKSGPSKKSGGRNNRNAKSGNQKARRDNRSKNPQASNKAAGKSGDSNNKGPRKPRSKNNRSRNNNKSKNSQS